MEEPEKEILVAGMDPLGRLRVDARRPLAGDPRQDVGVVGGQVDRHTDVAYPVRKRPCPPGRDRVDRRQPTILDQAPELQDGRVESLDVTYLDRTAAFTCRDHDS